METTSQNIHAEICREKKERILVWLSTSEAPESERFTVARLFEYGVLPQSIYSLFLYHLRREFQEEAAASNHIGNDLSEEVIAKMILTPEHITALLEVTIDDAFVYCASPQRFLLDFLSDERSLLALDDAFFTKLNALKDHEYFPDILRAWAENTTAHKIATISASELSEYIAEIDGLILRYATISQVVDLLLPLYDFYNHRDANPPVDKEILISFFADKKLTEVIDCLQRSEKTHFLMKELVELLSTMIKPQAEVGQPIANNIEVPLHPVETAPVLQYEEFLSDLRGVGIVYQPSVAVSSHSRIPFEVFINSKLRTRCIKSVFHGNEKDYRRLIKTIDSTNEFEKAKLNLESTLLMQSVDTDSKVGKQLFDALKLRYHRKETIL